MMNLGLMLGAIAAVATFSASLAFAAPAPAGSSGVCAAATAAILDDEKSLSSYTGDLLAEDSAARAGYEAGELNAAYQNIQVNLTVMIMNHCAAYPHAIVATAFLTVVLACKTDLIKGNSSSTACTRST